MSSRQPLVPKDETGMALQGQKLKVRPLSNGKPAVGRTGKGEHIQRTTKGGRTKTVTPVQGYPYGFLTEKIEPIPRYILDLPMWLKMDVPGSRDYLFTVFTEYLELLGKKITCTKTDDPMHDIITIYHEFCSKIPEGDECNLLYDEDNEPLKAVVYRLNGGYDHEYCHLHLTLYDILGKSCKKWYKDFVSFLMAAQNFHLIMDNYHFEMMYDIEVDEMEQFRQEKKLDADERERLNDMKKIFRPYMPGGRIHKALTEVSRKIVTAEQLKESYKKMRIPKNVKPFMEYMYNAIDMLDENYLMDYSMSATADNIHELVGYNGENSLSLDYLLTIIYDDDDEVTDTVSRALDEEVGNTEDVVAKDYIILEPGNKNIIERSDFPGDFVRWFSNLYDIYRTVRDIKKNERSNKIPNIKLPA